MTGVFRTRTRRRSTARPAAAVYAGAPITSALVGLGATAALASIAMAVAEQNMGAPLGSAAALSAIQDQMGDGIPGLGLSGLLPASSPVVREGVASSFLSLASSAGTIVWRGPEALLPLSVASGASPLGSATMAVGSLPSFAVVMALGAPLPEDGRAFSAVTLTAAASALAAEGVGATTVPEALSSAMGILTLSGNSISQPLPPFSMLTAFAVPILYLVSNPSPARTVRIAAVARIVTVPGVSRTS